TRNERLFSGMKLIFTGLIFGDGGETTFAQRNRFCLHEYQSCTCRRHARGTHAFPALDGYRPRTRQTARYIHACGHNSTSTRCYLSGCRGDTFQRAGVHPFSLRRKIEEAVFSTLIYMSAKQLVSTNVHPAHRVTRWAAVHTKALCAAVRIDAFVTTRRNPE